MISQREATFTVHLISRRKIAALHLIFWFLRLLLQQLSNAKFNFSSSRERNSKSKIQIWSNWWSLFFLVLSDSQNHTDLSLITDLADKFNVIQKLDMPMLRSNRDNYMNIFYTFTFQLQYAMQQYTLIIVIKS